MKKTAKTLTLHRETLAHLDARRVGLADGGLGFIPTNTCASICPLACDPAKKTVTCGDSCWC